MPIQQDPTCTHAQEGACRHDLMSVRSQLRTLNVRVPCTNEHMATRLQTRARLHADLQMFRPAHAGMQMFAHADDTPTCMHTECLASHLSWL